MTKKGKLINKLRNDKAKLKEEVMVFKTRTPPKRINPTGRPMTRKERTKYRKSKVKLQRKAKRQLHRQKAIGAASFLSGVTFESPLTPTKTVVPIDISSFYAFVLTSAKWLSVNTDLFKVVEPAQYKMYCYAMLLSHLLVNGDLQGTFKQNITLILMKGTNVPTFLMKYLEYLSPHYEFGSALISGYLYNDEFVSPNPSLGFGDQSTDPVNQTNQSQCYIFPQVDNTGSPPTVYQGTTEFQNVAYAQPLTLTNFLQNGQLDFVASTLSRFMPCGDFLDIGREAPDASAYARTSSGSLFSEFAGKVNMLICEHEHFDAEIALMYCIWAGQSTAQGVFTKPVPLPEYDYNSQYSLNSTSNFVAPWEQIMAVAQYVSINADSYHKKCVWKKLRMFNDAGKGKLRNGSELVTFYPGVRMLSSETFTTLALHWYQSYQSNQAGAAQGNTGTTNPTVAKASFANETGNGSVLWSLLYLSFAAFCNRFYRQCVIYGNMPLIAGYPPTQGVLMPQFMYQSKAVEGLRLPTSVADQISDIGAFVRDGKLILPVSDFNAPGQISFPVPAANALGPLAWSGFGYTVDADQTYPYNNILTTPLGPGLVGGPLNIKLTNLVISNTFMTTHYAFNVVANVLYTAFLSGPYPAMVETLFIQYLSSNNNTANYTKLLAKVPQKCWGDQKTMDTFIFLSTQAANLQPAVPNNLAVPTPTGTDQTPVIFRAQFSSAASSNLLSSGELLRKAQGTLMSQNNQITKPDSVRREYKLMKVALFKNTAQPSVFANDSVNGRNALVFPSGSSLNIAVDALTNATSAPNSSLGKMMEKQREERPSISGFMTLKHHKLLQNSDWRKLYAKFSDETAEGCFHNGAVECPYIDPKMLGPMLPKGLTPQAAAGAVKIGADHGIVAQGKETPVVHPSVKDKLKRDVSKTLDAGVKVIKDGTKDVAKKTVDVFKDMAGDAMSFLG